MIRISRSQRATYSRPAGSPSISITSDDAFS